MRHETPGNVETRMKWTGDRGRRRRLTCRQRVPGVALALDERAHGRARRVGARRRGRDVHDVHPAFFLQPAGGVSVSMNRGLWWRVEGDTHSLDGPSPALGISFSNSHLNYPRARQRPSLSQLCPLTHRPHSQQHRPHQHPDAQHPRLHHAFPRHKLLVREPRAVRVELRLGGGGCRAFGGEGEGSGVGRVGGGDVEVGVGG